MAKLFRLTKEGHRLVKQAVAKFSSLNDCANQKNQRRQTFTKFCNGDGVMKETAETYCDVLEIANWRENWKSICELVPEPNTSWFAYDDRTWVGRKQLITELTAKLSESCRLLMLLGISGIGKTALAEYIANQIQSQFSNILTVMIDRKTLLALRRGGWKS